MTEFGSEDAARGEMLLYRTEDGRTRVECRFQDDTLWLTQSLMAELFQTSTQNITLHLRTLYQEEELTEKATCKEYLQVRMEGERRVQRAVKHLSMPETNRFFAIIQNKLHYAASPGGSAARSLMFFRSVLHLHPRTEQRTR